MSQQRDFCKGLSEREGLLSGSVHLGSAGGPAEPAELPVAVVPLGLVHGPPAGETLFALPRSASATSCLGQPWETLLARHGTGAPERLPKGRHGVRFRAGRAEREGLASLDRGHQTPGVREHALAIWGKHSSVWDHHRARLLSTRRERGTSLGPVAALCCLATPPTRPSDLTPGPLS